MSSIAPRVPITTVSGFLGAGKTTLVNHLLRHASGQRIVVFVNDFGAINIDRDMIETREENRVSLKNGCVCCSLNADLVAGVAQFARATQPPDAFLIEASGVSDPKSLNASLSRLEGAGLTRMDLRLYVIDAALYGTLGYADTELLLDHAATSDLVLINKADLATDVHRHALAHDLEEAAPFSVVMETRQCAVDPSVLTGPLLSRGSEMQRRRAAKPSEDPIHHFRTWSFEVDRSFCRDRFVEMLRELPRYCVRAKGFVRFSAEPAGMHVFHLVGMRVDIESCVLVTEHTSRMVFIGPEDRFDEKHIELLVRSALSPER